jgi:DNA invertase Pin-like site-specific DNA recombinase
MNKIAQKITALYCQSAIKNEAFINKQKELLTDYVHSNNIPNYKFYIDNGFSGATLNRLDFKRLMADSKKGIIAAVVVAHNNRLLSGYPEQ